MAAIARGKGCSCEAKAMLEGARWLVVMGQRGGGTRPRGQLRNDSERLASVVQCSRRKEWTMSDFRKLRWLAGLALMVITIVSACAAPAPEQTVVGTEQVTEEPTSEAIATPTPASEPQPVSGGTLTYGIRLEPPSLDPVRSNTWPFTHGVATWVYDTLVASDNEGSLYPGLAESWEVSDDGLVVTLHLKEGVEFHDGTPFDAQAVKAYFDRIMDPDWCCGNAYRYIGSYESSAVLDDYTIEVKFSVPHGAFIPNLASYYLGSIYSPAAVDEWGMDESSQHPVGTGPFKFVEWEPQSRLVYEKNPDYSWPPQNSVHVGPAYLDNIVVKFVPEPAARVGCLEAGECTVIHDPPYPDIQRLRDDPRFQVLMAPQKGMPLSWMFNTVRPPTDDVQVRKALNLAVDRRKINEAAYSGERLDFYTVLTSSTPEYWPGAEDHIYYDPDEAEAILEEAGWVDSDGDGIRDKNAEPLMLDMYTFGEAGTPYRIACEVVQAELRKVGVDAQIQVIPVSDWPVIAAEKKHNMLMFNMPHWDASILLTLFHSREAPREGHYGMGATWFHEASPEVAQELDELLDEAPRTPTFEERKLIYWQVQEIIAENHLIMPGSQGFEVLVADRSVRGIRFDAGNVPVFFDAWIEE